MSCADAAGEQRELPLIKIIAGHQELEMVFVAQEELVVRDFVRVAAPALLEHNRKDVDDPLRNAGPSGPRTSTSPSENHERPTLP